MIFAGSRAPALMKMLLLYDSSIVDPLLESKLKLSELELAFKKQE